MYHVPCLFSALLSRCIESLFIGVRLDYFDWDYIVYLLIPSSLHFWLHSLRLLVMYIHFLRHDVRALFQEPFLTTNQNKKELEEMN